MLPLALCAGEGDGMLMVIVGAVALVLMQQRTPPPAPRVYGPERYASARVAETNSGEEYESTENVTEPTERVPNPRKSSSDVEKTTEVETTRVPATHIVGFRWNRSDESRARLLARQHKEMSQYTLHQYE